MADELKKDKYGDEYRVVDGKELIALWVPVTLDEKEKLMAKAAAKGIRVQESVANFLRESLHEKGGKELGIDDLEKVVGGVMSFPTTSFTPPSLQQPQFTTPERSDILADKFRSSYSTVMCPW